MDAAVALLQLAAVGALAAVDAAVALLAAVDAAASLQAAVEALRRRRSANTFDIFIPPSSFDRSITSRAPRWCADCSRFLTRKVFPI